MKNVILTLIFAASFATCASGQSFHLNPGESYVFSFDASLLPAPVASPFGNGAVGIASLTINGEGDRGCHWLLEMFENNVTEAPLRIWEQERSEDCSLSVPAIGAWQDLQGMVRVTAIGPADVSPLEVEINVPSPGGPLYYDGQIQAVPEPSVAALLAVGGAVGLFCSGRRRASFSLLQRACFAHRLRSSK